MESAPHFLAAILDWGSFSDEVLEASDCALSDVALSELYVSNRPLCKFATLFITD